MEKGGKNHEGFLFIYLFTISVGAVILLTL
jgi:hypothetical protein